jgi:hypothetical protein
MMRLRTEAVMSLEALHARLAFIQGASGEKSDVIPQLPAAQHSKIAVQSQLTPLSPGSIPPGEPLSLEPACYRTRGLS